MVASRLHPLDPNGFPAADHWVLNAQLLDPGPPAHATKKADWKSEWGQTDGGCSCAEPSTMVTLPHSLCEPAPQMSTTILPRRSVVSSTIGSDSDGLMLSPPPLQRREVHACICTFRWRVPPIFEEGGLR